MPTIAESPSFFAPPVEVPLGIQKSLEGINLDPKRGTINFQEDLLQIRALQKRFNEALGINPRDNEVIRSYNPVLARWKYEQQTGAYQKEQFKVYELQQMKTNLKERYRSAKSTVNYKIDDKGEVYNELFPDEPVDVVLRRGLAYRKEQGSPELEREEAEIEGWLKIKKVLTSPDTPIGTKATVISGPGLVKGTTYTDNFVDVYELVVDPKTGEKMIKMTRHASNMTYGEYYNEFSRLDKDSLKNIDGPFDAFLLKNPLINKEFKFKERGLEEDSIGEIIQACQPLILYYLDVLCSEPFDPKNVALAFNAILKMGDLVRTGKHMDINLQRLLAGNIQGAAGMLGRLPILGVGAGCGLSSGFGIKGGDIFNPLSLFMINSVGQFGAREESWDYQRGDCVNCGRSQTEVGPCSICKGCELILK
jgi:hypothetical protein